MFNRINILHKLKHYLPSQTPLKDFIHHNSLHAFQDLKFYDAIFRASKIFGYQITLQLSEFRKLHRIGRIRSDIVERVIVEKKGAAALEQWKHRLFTEKYDESNVARIGQLQSNWKRQYHIDPASLVHPLLFRILCSYLDQGISIWKFPSGNDGFLASIRELEKNSFSSFFKTQRARQLLLSGNCELEELLKLVVGDETLFERYLFDQQFAHQGWSGMVCAIEEQPHSLLETRLITLHDLIVFELLLELDALDFHLGKQWRPLSHNAKIPPTDLFADTPSSELREVFTLWQDAFEWSYYDEVLAAIDLNKNSIPLPIEKINFQALFCIDERECSLRQYVELVDANSETYGTPGFFSVEFYFQQENAKFYHKLCPAPVTPKHLIKEFGTQKKREHEFLYTKTTHTFFRGFLSTITLGFLAGIRLFQNIFKPKMSPAISNAFLHMDPDSQLTIENESLEDREAGLQVGFTVEEMAHRVEGLLRGIGLIKEFAPLVYAIAHGSSSANNPHHGAHDCGACSGRPGSVNARVYAFMANHPRVRDVLKTRGLTIPSETQFLGALHDTASDEMEFYDEEALSPANRELHKRNIHTFEQALDLNAKERSRRFASIDTKMDIKKIRAAIQRRSVSLFEPRPELGHGTNTLCIVGNRQLTKELFLDRRAFMNSYDYKTDPEGALLTGIMKPLGPVCGGINLEYYFSRVDNHKLGAGTKLPHHVMGLFGVANSADGDLRPGLPVQMIEVHDPMRLLILVEHFPNVVLKAIQSTADMYEWFINQWVHLVVINPDTHQFLLFKDGGFTPYTPLKKDIHSVQDIASLIESAREMETNQIADATLENLPIYLLRRKMGKIL